MLLKPFGIVPGTKRDGDYHFKGYELEQVIDAFTRYLDDSSVTNEPDVTDRKGVSGKEEQIEDETSGKMRRCMRAEMAKDATEPARAR
jgi:hypothetical protein